MCAQFEIEKSMFLEKLEKLQLNVKDFEDNVRILPHTKAPAIRKKDAALFVDFLNFSLIPRWSKDRKPKFATHNARLESIKDKPTWKNIFGKKHCLVPLTSFIEPIYEGEYAGNMVKFKLPECLLVPAVYDVWNNNTTGEVIESFAIVTSAPPPYVAEIGHDRSPIFLNQDEVLQWLETNNKNDNFFFNFLNKKLFPNFSIEIDRKMKKGWEKRI